MLPYPSARDHGHKIDIGVLDRDLFSVHVTFNALLPAFVIPLHQSRVAPFCPVYISDSKSGDVVALEVRTA